MRLGLLSGSFRVHKNGRFMVALESLCASGSGRHAPQVQHEASAANWKLQACNAGRALPDFQGAVQGLAFAYFARAESPGHH